ncbi:MAG: M23 family metallopeptidase, partial [Candidatus Zixiibacteriota bacterium]
MPRLAKYLLFLLLLPVQFSSGAELQWPLKREVSLSSIFCDYRPFHYHSGLDLRTGGKVGVRVYAPGDGHLYRSYTSFWGYGRALYIRLNDGRILVFGHLSRFNSEIEKRVFREQVKNRSYYTNVFYEPGEVPIKKGQLIGYTGQTGSGGPHLHFEMRDQNNNPINPLKNGYKIEDTLPPRFLNLAIRDLSPRTPWRDSGRCEIIPAYYARAEAGYELIE